MTRIFVRLKCRDEPDLPRQMSTRPKMTGTVMMNVILQGMEYRKTLLSNLLSVLQLFQSWFLMLSGMV